MKKDSTIQALLIIAIAVVYPLVIFFAVYALLPASSAGRGNQDSLWLNRGVISLVLSILTTIVAVLSLRTIHEVFRGLVAGSVLTTIISIIIITSVGAGRESIDYRPVRVTLLLFTFLFLTGLMFAAEQLLDVKQGPVLAQEEPRPAGPQPAAAPTEAQPEQPSAHEHHNQPPAPPNTHSS